MAEHTEAARIAVAVRLLKRGKISRAEFARRVQEILDDGDPRKKPVKRQGKKP